jgi:hypothetical protein
MAVINTCVPIWAAFDLTYYAPLGCKGVAAWLVEDNTSVRVQQCAYVADTAMLFCTLSAVIALDRWFAVRPFFVFAVSFCNTGIFETK